MKIDISKFNDEVQIGLDLCAEIERNGYEAYIVGGCVRDIIRYVKNGNKGDPNIHDVDIATNMPIDELYDKFKCRSNNGEAHGTILVLWKGEVFEVTQFRVDGDYSDGRHPDSVSFTKSFKDDTDRRDFTINAMGIDCDGNVIDYHNGVSDLEGGILKTVGRAEDRFTEDSLRIIRAMRFAARFGMKLDDDVEEGIESVKGKLSGIARERIGAELVKTSEYGCKAMKDVIGMMRKTGVNNVIDPNGIIDWDIGYSLLKKRNDRDNVLGFVCLFTGCEDIREACRLFRLENDVMKTCEYCYKNYEFMANWKTDLVRAATVLNNKDIEVLDEYMRLVLGEGIENTEDLKELGKIAGRESKKISQKVMDMGYRGPDVGKMIKKISQWYYGELLNGNDVKLEDYK